MFVDVTKRYINQKEIEDLKGNKVKEDLIMGDCTVLRKDMGDKYQFVVKNPEGFRRSSYLVKDGAIDSKISDFLLGCEMDLRYEKKIFEGWGK